MGNETIKGFKELEEYIYFSKEESTLKFIAIIIDFKISVLNGFIQLTLISGNQKCEQFIIKENRKVYIRNEIIIQKIDVKRNR